MIFTINGVDITPFIAFGGLQYSLNDVDAPNTGRSMDATMHRSRVASKVRWDVTCRPLKTDEVQTVLNAIEPEWVTVQFTNPLTGYAITKTMYSNNRKAKFMMHRNGANGGYDLWQIDAFPLIER